VADDSARAPIANGVYVAAVNRVGYEARRSMAWNSGAARSWPIFGVVVAEGDHAAEETLIVECDPRRIEEVRRNWPFCATAASTPTRRF